MSDPVATFETSMGTFKAEIYEDQMPITAGNFLKLAESGFYNGLHFHRVIPNFMISLDVLNPKTHTVHDVVPVALDMPFLMSILQSLSNEVGTLSMANSGPNSGGSQFFINTKHNAYLDWFDGRTPSAHPVFGKITDGMHVVVQHQWRGS